MADFVIKQGDTEPALEAQLLDPEGGPINLQGATVTLCVGRHVRSPMQIIDAPEGRVRYTWQPGDTDLPGTWNAEFLVRFASGVVQRVPNEGHITVQVARSVCGRDE